MTPRALSKEISLFLKRNGIEDWGFEAEQLIMSALSLTLSQLVLSQEEVSEEKETKIRSLAQRRIKGEPLQYIIGEWEFYSLPFIVGKGVLIPRPDTEVLVENALDFLYKKETARVIDLCSGSGCIAIAVSVNSPECEVFALEKSAEAYSYLKKNIKKNKANVKLLLGDINNTEIVEGEFDLILSNPPYIKTEAMNNLQKEVTFEPRMALSGGEDGLDFYRIILDKWAPRLNKGGKLMVEIGFDQSEAVVALFEKANLTEITPIKDLNGVSRVIVGTRNI